MLPGRQPFKVGVYVTCGTLGPGSSEQAVATEQCLPYMGALERAATVHVCSRCVEVVSVS